jgi:hypothetical protein
MARILMFKNDSLIKSLLLMREKNTLTMIMIFVLIIEQGRTLFVIFVCGPEHFSANIN